MKKGKSGSTDKPASSRGTPATADKSNKQDISAGTPRKLSATDKTSAKPLAKNLSRSQDNLASQLRRKHALSQKEAGQTKGGAPNTPKGKPPKSVTLSKNVQSQIEGAGTPIKRAQSAHNITKAPNSQASKSATPVVKRASSTQNISQEKSGHRQMRISAPENIMAYNAELLANFEKEKKLLEARISELVQVAETRKNTIEKFKFEVKNLKEQNSGETKEQLEMLQHDNRLLRDRLNELGVTVDTHITDSEKLSLLQKSAPSTDSSTEAKAVITEDHVIKGIQRLLEGGEGGERLTVDSELGLSVGDLSCITPEHPSSLSLDYSNWDKQSNKSSDAMSEMSVANLQDRISQMEETHYSTSEELQATLHELTDLQDMVNELTNDSERLTTERCVLLESLCAQTEKLENSRMQIEHLKALLVNENEDADRSEHEKQLVGLIRSAQEEREEFVYKQRELSNSLETLETENKQLQDVITALRDQTDILDSKNKSLIADKRALEAQTTELHEQNAKDQIELQRYRTLLENEKSKVTELEQFRNATDKTDLEELLDNARQEKDKVEDKLANVQEELAVSQNEVAKLKEQLNSTEEELKVAKNNAKTQVSDLTYSLEQMSAEKTKLMEEMESLRDHIDQLQIDCDRYLEEQKTLNASITALEMEKKVAFRKNRELEAQLRKSQCKYFEEQEEWKQFQADLQTAVVIANEFKTEAQEDIDTMATENVSLKEKNMVLTVESAKLQEELNKLHAQQERSDIRGRVVNNVDRELTALRQNRKLSEPWGGGQQNLSVKNLIASIEHQVQTERATPPLSPSQASSRRDSTDSNFSSISIGSMKPDSPTKSPNDRRSSGSGEMALKSLLRKPSESKDSRQPLAHRHTLTNIIYDTVPPPVYYEDPKAAPEQEVCGNNGSKKSLTSILSNKSAIRKNSLNDLDAGKQDKGHPAHGPKVDPLANLVKQVGGSKRNALLKWCQNKTQNFVEIDITNFSSSWNDGLAFCALLHTYLPDKIPYKDLSSQDKKRNFMLAFKAAESVGIASTLSINDMIAIERPDWQAVMSYVTSIYKHFEVDNKS